MATAAFTKKKALFTSKLHLNLRKTPVNCYIWSKAFNFAETEINRKVVQKYLKSFRMWYRRRVEKISRTNRVRNEEVLYGVKEERNILYTVKLRKANWIGHSLHRNCLLLKER
jgi:hypothetical protein